MGRTSGGTSGGGGGITTVTTVTGATAGTTGTLYIANTNAVTITLPAAPAVGALIGLARGSSTGLLTFTAPTGSTIDGGASGGSVNVTGGGPQKGQLLALIATSATSWQTAWIFGTDRGFSWENTGTWQQAGVMTFTTGLVLKSTSKTANYTTALGDNFVRCTANSFTVTMTQQASDQILIVDNEGTGTITLAVTAGSYFGPPTLGPNSAGRFISDGTNWRCIGSSGTNTNTAPVAAASSPTLGAAAQLAQTTADSEVYVQVGTSGTLTIAIGPTVGLGTTILSTAAAVAGSLYSFRLPAGWFVAVTTSTTAAWTATAVTC